MTPSATADRPIPANDAWPLEARQRDAITVIERAFTESRLGKLKPGYLAGTFGLTKTWVREEIQRRCELGGGGK